MILGIDVGGTAAKIGSLTREGKILRRKEVPVNGDGYATPILTSVLAGADAFLAEEPDSGESLEGIAVSATGQVDDKSGTVIGTNGAIPGYEGTCFRQALAEKYAVSVHVLNDANAAALGETFLGGARGCRDVVMVTLGTGVGGGVISGGKLIRDRRGIAGELGHFSVDRNGALCTCGQRGCFERYASTTALMRMVWERTDREKVPDGRAFFDLVRAGEAEMKDVLERWIQQIAVGVIGLVHIFNPEIVLIGGGVSRQENLLISPLRKKVIQGMMPRFAEGFRLEAATLGNDAGMIGALKFWLEEEKNR